MCTRDDTSTWWFTYSLIIAASCSHVSEEIYNVLGCDACFMGPLLAHRQLESNNVLVEVVASVMVVVTVVFVAVAVVCVAVVEVVAVVDVRPVQPGNPSVAIAFMCPIALAQSSAEGNLSR